MCRFRVQKPRGPLAQHFWQLQSFIYKESRCSQLRLTVRGGAAVGVTCLPALIYRIFFTACGTLEYVDDGVLYVLNKLLCLARVDPVGCTGLDYLDIACNQCLSGILVVYVRTGGPM